MSITHVLKTGASKKSDISILNALHNKNIVFKLTDFVFALIILVIVLWVIAVSLASRYCVILCCFNNSLTRFAVACPIFIL